MTGDDKISITLSLNDWNAVIVMLAKQPYEVAAPLIQSISAQAQAAAAAPSPEPIRMSPLNGQMDVKATEGGVAAK